MSHQTADPSASLRAGLGRQSPNLLSRLRTLLGLRPVPPEVAEELSALRTAVSALAQAQAEHQGHTAALREMIEKLDKQIARAGKEQFKANSLAEAQQQIFKSTLEQLREATTYRERELEHLRERLVGARAEGRMEMIRRLLPVLDGLDEALSAGQRLIAEAPVQGAGPSAAPSALRLRSGQASLRARLRAGSLRRRLSGAWALLAGRLPSDLQPGVQSASSPSATLRAGIAAWLEGLEFVRDRLFDILSAEGVRPLETDGETFDPHLHVAVEAVPVPDGLRPGAIVKETRRGYLVGDAVLRYAEVVVAR